MPDVRLTATLVRSTGPAGNRLVVPVTGGRAIGERISGEVVAPGGDWILLGADGWGSLDIRGQIRTDDGAVLYYRAEGVMEMNEAVQRYLAGTASTATCGGSRSGSTG